MTQQGETRGTRELQEREGVLSVLLDAYRDTCTGHASAVLLVGEAGSGKTSVLDALRQRLQHDGARVLHATCSPLEVDFPFAAVRQLLARSPHLRDPRASSGIEVGEPFAVLDALYWRVVDLAENAAAVVVVDDVHWADEATLRWLHFLLHRLEGVPVLVVLASRPLSEQRPLLTALASRPVVREVEVPLLSVSAARSLLRSSLGGALPDELALRCHEATGGNPFYLNALAVALREHGPARVAAALSEHSAPLPMTVRRAVLDRLRGLGPEAVSLVRAVTVLGPDAQAASLTAAADLSAEQVRAALQAAEEAGLLRAGATPAVRHPLVHDCVYADIPPDELTRLHREAARQLAAAGAEAERVAAHLVRTEPGDDIWVVEALLAGSRLAVQRGAPEAAASYLRRALREPLARRSAVLLLELGQAELLAGDPSATERLRDALALAEDDATLSTAATQLGRALVYAGQVPEAVAVLRDTRARLHEASGELAVRLDLEAVDAANLDARTVEQAEELLRGYTGWSGDRLVDRLVLAHLSAEPARTGRSASQAQALARAALADDALLAGEGGDSQSAYLPIIALFLSDALDEARVHLDAAVEQSRARSSVLGLCTASAWRSHVALRAGDVRAAGADAEAALTAATGAGLHVLTPYAVAFLSDALVERGELDAAEALWVEHSLTGPLPPVLPANYLLFSRGSLRAAQGRTAEAVTDLLDSGERQRQWRAAGVGFWPWASRAALALDRRGERMQARQLVEDELDAARAFGAPRPLGMALHAAALLERGPGRARALEQARDVLSASPARLEHARACVDLGAALLRTGRREEGVGQLEDGLRRAVDCGATALSDRARAELHAVGIPVRRGARDGVAGLTISERRVAELAAAGWTNREIAQTLFVAPKTVETHLARVFRKLAVSSRRDLAGLPELATTESAERSDERPAR